MKLDAGTRLGPCEILALIGAGGIGEVYKARDMRLDSVVAVKLCAEQVQQGLRAGSPRCGCAESS
jgi:hypothetical protein